METSLLEALVLDWQMGIRTALPGFRAIYNVKSSGKPDYKLNFDTLMALVIFLSCLEQLLL
jgi:hypothetical protein